MTASVLKKFLSAGAVAVAMSCVFSSPSMAAACLSNASDPVGNAVFGATVGTFTGLGVSVGDGTGGTTCIENGTWSDPSGFGLGNYVKGSDGQGYGYDPTVLGAYDGSTTGVGNANDRDFYWVQDVGNTGIFSGALGGAPSQGIIWDLGGQANQVAIFVFVDHGPVPGEVLENTAWLSNDPNAVDADWTQASLVHVYGDGWSPDPDIADGFVAVYQLAGGATFRYVSVTWGGPGAIVRDGDNEIDAVGGLTEGGSGVNGIPEPGTLALFGAGLAGLGIMRRRRKIAA